ncbi:hypothetical protein [Pseudactinotalea sp.]|uniref:hypothetical protein n=1 Tax=Pseudactinotalea sp. TaxID=1926260 RepID=UPI003B3B956F
MVQPNTRRVATTAGILALVLVGATISPATASDPAADERSDDSWYAWADDAADEVEATDWEALSAADGCELVDLTIAEVVDPVANAAVGAPEDLAVTVVEREEICSTSSAALRTASVRASGCSTTSGPGTLCISRSGNYVSTSFQYNGSSTISAYLRLYKIGSTSGCPTGTVLATSSTQSYSNGTRRSLSVYSPSSGAYSSHVWRHVGLGHYTDWGAACGNF